MLNFENFAAELISINNFNEAFIMDRWEDKIVDLTNNDESHEVAD